jgi:hypothetical protein
MCIEGKNWCAAHFASSTTCCTATDKTEIHLAQRNFTISAPAFFFSLSFRVNNTLCRLHSSPDNNGERERERKGSKVCHRAAQ